MKQTLRDIPSIFRHRDLRLMLPARALSTFGDDVAIVALMLRVYESGRGPWAMTGLLVCAALPVVALAPLAGRLADSSPFRTLAATTALWQAGCCVALAFETPLWSTYLLVLLLQAGHAVAGPTWQALIPEIAPREELARTIGAAQALNTLAAVAAPAAAGVLVAFLGAGAPLVIDAATFLALGGAALAIRATRGLHDVAEPADRATPVASFRLRDDALLLPLLLGLCVLVLVGEGTNVVEVFLLRGTLGAGPGVFGLVAAGLACGLVVGSLAVGGSASDATRARRAVLAALVLGLTLAAGGLAPTLPAFAVAWAALGVANGMVNADVSTLLLGRTPEPSRGRVLATVNAVVRGSSLVALALGGAAGSVLGPRATFVLAGALMTVAAAVVLVRIRSALAQATAADPAVAA
jgi:MFS family permease